MATRFAPSCSASPGKSSGVTSSGVSCASPVWLRRKTSSSSWRPSSCNMRCTTRAFVSCDRVTSTGNSKFSFSRCCVTSRIFSRAGLFFAQKVERVPNHHQFQIRRGGARDHACSACPPAEFAATLPAPGVLRLAAQRLVEDLLLIRHAEERGRAPSRRFRNAVGVAGARSGVEIRQKLRLGDHRGAIGEARLELRHLNVLAVLQREFDGVLQRQRHRRRLLTLDSCDRASCAQTAALERRQQDARRSDRT